MTTVNWPKGTLTVSNLRNGAINTSGIELMETARYVDLFAINSRGNTATGCISLPNDAQTLKSLAMRFAALAVKAAAQEDAESGVYPTRADYTATAQAGIQDYEYGILDDALVTEGDDGAYVQVWKWIPDSDVKAAPSQKAWVAATNDGCCAVCQSPKGVDYDSRDNGVQHARCECGAECVEHSDPLDDNETPTVLSVDVISLRSAEVAA
jgi:hypothetical protein